MTESNGQRPLRNISHSWCFYNRSPIKLNALDRSKCMYKALGSFLSSRCSKIEKKPDRKDVEREMEVGNFEIVETFHRQLRPSTQIQRAANVQKRKYNDITRLGNTSSENLYSNEKIPKRLKASNSSSDISWCSFEDDVNSECLRKGRSSNVSKRQPLDSKLCPLPTEDYRRKLRSSHSMVEAHKNCESTRKHSLSSSYSGNSNGSGSCTDRSYVSDLEVICEFQCRPIFVILEKLSKRKIKQLTSVGNVRTESVEATREKDPNKVPETVDFVNTKNVAKGKEASHLTACKSFEKFLRSSCVQNIEATELPMGNLSDQLEHIGHDLEKGATGVIDVSSTSLKFDRCFGTGMLDSKKISVRLIGIENESKELVRAKGDHITEKLKFRQVQDSDRTAAPVTSAVHMRLEGKSAEKNLSRDIVDSISTDSNAELPLKTDNSAPSGDHVDNGTILPAGGDTSPSSDESTIDLSDEWTLADYHKLVSDDNTDSPQISDPTSDQNASKLSDGTRILRAVGISDHENFGLPACFSNGNLLTTLESLPEQHSGCTPVKSEKRDSKINGGPVCGRKRSGPHRNGSKWGNRQRDCSNDSCGDNRNDGTNLSSTDNNRNGSGANQSNSGGSQRKRFSEKYSFGYAERSSKEKKDHSIGKNNSCANRNTSCTHIKLSYLGTIDTRLEHVKKTLKESVLYESESDSDESLFKNCSQFSNSGFSDTTTAEQRTDEDHFKVRDVTEDECDLSDLYVPNFMTHSPHLHCRDDSANEWRRVADLEEWWLNDRVNFEPSLENQINVLPEDECQSVNAESERRPLAPNAFQWCAMLADQSEWPDIDLCSFHDEGTMDGYHLNTVKGLCANKDKVATSTQDVVFYSAENGKIQTDGLFETADSFAAESKPFNRSICQMTGKREISLDAASELSLKTRNESGFLGSEPDIKVKLDSGVFSATDILCLTKTKSEAVKSDSLDKFTHSSAAISRDFNSNFDHSVSSIYDPHLCFASKDGESRLSMPFLASYGSHISKGVVSQNHTSAAAASSNHISPSPVYDDVIISQMQATTCSHSSSQSSFVNTCYASLCQHNSSVCSKSSSLLNEDISVACSLTVSSTVSLVPKESSCSNLGLVDFSGSRKFVDNAASFSAYDQKPCYPAFTASSRCEIAPNCLNNATSLPSEARFMSSVSSTDDGNPDIIKASSSFNSPGMIRDSLSSLVCSETTPNAKVCQRAVLQNEQKTPKRCSNDLPASERNLLLSEKSDNAIRTQSALAEYNLKSSHKTCTLDEDPVISNDNGSASFDDCNSDMCSWLAASMGLYTCICGAAFSDSWSCLQHQFKCSVMTKQ